MVTTCDQVAVLTTVIANGFQQNLKTGAVFLDLTAHCLAHWSSFTNLVKALPSESITILVHPTGGSAASRSSFQGAHGQWHQFGPQCKGLSQGSVLAPVLFNLYSNDLPVTRGRKFVYADDIRLAIQGQYFSELECSLSSDMARMSHFCQQW